MRLHVFRETRRSREFTGPCFAARPRWVTWHPTFLRRLLAVEHEVRSLHLRRKAIPEQKPYPSTWQLELEGAPATAFFLEAAAELQELELGSEVVFLTGLLADVDTMLLKRTIAGLRAALVARTGSELAALHAAVHRSSRGTGFALHADVFVPRRLFLVFDDVPAAGSGTLLLPRRRFESALGAARVPLRVQTRIRALLRGDRRADGFTPLFDLCHGDHPWTPRLEAELERRQACVSLTRGQGYLLDDREWLHGRQPGPRAVRAHRFHRLVF